MYAVQQTYTNYVTGEHWTRVIKKRWLTYRGAEQAASRVYSWVTKPDGQTAIDSADAEVIEVPA
jgi:hypothetical protein